MTKEHSITAPEASPAGSAAEPVLPPDWFVPRAAPLEIDLGCHKGTFLVAMAALHPERNFLGCERQSSRVERCMSKVRRLQLANAWAVQGEALPFLQQHLLPSCADVIHLLFPDPWPKRRHHARRLFQKDFLAACHRVLKPGGLLRAMTDDEDYAVAMKSLVAENNILAQEDFHALTGYPETEFQKKFLEIGKPFHGLALRKAS